jgi:AcrR family transcriptional regulator
MATSKRKQRTPTLTAERIREAALQLIDEDGIDSFSTRKLGAALGCEAMAIYWYYPSKDALLDAVVEQMVARIPIEPADDGDWIDAFRKLAHAYRKLAHLHPKTFPLLATRRFATAGTYRFLEGLFELARGAGLDDRTTARFYRIVSSYCSGIALNELAGLRDRAREDDAAEMRASFPRVEAVWRWLEPDYFDETFDFGLELLLEALAKAPRRATGRDAGAVRRRRKRA